jgi:uncharacterized protein YjbI with pentapeptide repeats
MSFTIPPLPKDLAATEDISLILKNSDDVDEVHASNGSIAGLSMISASISDSLIEKYDVSAVNMDKLQTTITVYKNVDFSGSKFPNSSWRNVQILSSRCGGVQMQHSSLKNVKIMHSKLEIANFRYCKLENVLFEGCLLDDIDFYGSTLKNVEFKDCTISLITFAAAKMNNVDLTNSTIESINGLSSIKGATISYDQLLQFAPNLAAEAGIKVK